MEIIETKLKGAFVIDPEKLIDKRGFFARTWDKKKFEEMHLNPRIAQCSISFNRKKGTIRGMHFQESPYEEDKLVRCTRGKIYDVIIDIRSNSKTFKQWIGVELSAENYKMLYVPAGFAHGFQTLEDDTEVFYQISEYYHPDCSRGIKWNDEAFVINWPFEPSIISEKDLSFKPFE